MNPQNIYKNILEISDQNCINIEVTFLYFQPISLKPKITKCNWNFKGIRDICGKRFDKWTAYGQHHSLKQIWDKWSIRFFFGVEYQPSSNRIVKVYHRTIIFTKRSFLLVEYISPNTRRRINATKRIVQI